MFYNFTVDKLIKNLGDPRVAEKLRIYRLVEDQFATIEAQVKKEVCLCSITFIIYRTYLKHWD